MEDRQLKTLFSETIQGFSVFYSKSFGEIYIKHFTPLDSADIDFVYNSSFNKAIENGLLTKTQREQELIEQELWTPDQENKIKELKQLINNLNSTISKEYLKSKRDIYKKSVIDIEKDIKDLEKQKYQLIGNTAEFFAIKKSNEFYIESSFFKTRELKNRLFNYQEFEELEGNKLEELINIFNEYNNKFDHNNLRMVSLSSVFMSMFNLSSENSYEFYGKPVIYLTFHQIDLFNFGRMYKNIFSQYGDRIPKSVINDSEKLSEWLEINQNADKIIGSDKEGGAISYMGAKKEDLEYLGVDTGQVVDFKKIAAKKGKTKLTMEDMMELG